jgi:hypothetical protein
VFLFFQSLSLGWWGWAQLTMGIRVFSKTSWEMWDRVFPRTWRCQDMSRFPICMRSPLSLFIMGGGL